MKITLGVRTQESVSPMQGGYHLVLDPERTKYKPKVPFDFSPTGCGVVTECCQSSSV